MEINDIPVGVEIMLYTGGEEDGTVMRIPYVVHDLGKIDFERQIEQKPAEGGGTLTVSEIVLYQWDGTYNSSGQARYRDTGCKWQN
jgi:hypothetical protein